jgi:hypothetical protein
MTTQSAEAPGSNSSDKTAAIAQLANPQEAIPFWQRMPVLFLFPLQPPPLTRNLGASLVFCIVCSIALAPGGEPGLGLALLVLGAWIGTSLFVARFAFLVIERTSSGYLDSRSYPMTDDPVDWRRPVKMFLVMVLVPTLLLVASAKGILPPKLVLLLLLVFTLLLPASVMVITMTDSIGDAINPLQCWNTAWKIELPYLLLCLFLLMLFIGSGQAIDMVRPHPHPPLAADAAAGAVAPPLPMSPVSASFLMFAFTAIGNYFLILICVLIGYTMYQYSSVLGIEVVGPGDTTAKRGPVTASAHARRVREAMIGRLVAAGDFREAIELINGELRERPSDLSLHVRLHTLLVHEGSQVRIEDHALRYIELLMAANNKKEALALYEKTRASYPEFRPRDAARLPELAAVALDEHKAGIAADLIRGFDKKFPGHQNIPDVYVIGARVMLQAGREQEAQQLLQHVMNTYKDSPAAAQAKRYLQRFA